MPNNKVAEVASHFRGVKIENSALVQNFKKGDLLYGIEEVRDIFRGSLKGKVSEEKITIDEYNNKLLYKFLDDDYLFLSSLKDKNNQAAVESLVSEWGLDEDEKKYIEHSLSHPKFTPRNEQMKPLAKKNNLGDEEEFRKEVKIRRLCKAALTSPNKKIHFCLDTLVQAQAITKWDAENNRIDNGYTDAELRWLYKNWDTTEGIKDKVIFYNKGKKCDAPWLGAGQKEWQNYKKSSFYSELSQQPQVEKKIPKRKAAKNLFADSPANSDSEQNVSDKNITKPKRKLFFDLDNQQEKDTHQKLKKPKRLMFGEEKPNDFSNPLTFFSPEDNSGDEVNTNANQASVVKESLETNNASQVISPVSKKF
jgi:hypothetical protein